MITLWLCLASALAKPPPEDWVLLTEEPVSAEPVVDEAPDAAAPDEEPFDVFEIDIPVEKPAALEITVWGENAIRQARAAIVREMERMGYKAIDKPEGVVVFRPPQRWMGKGILDGEGDLRFTRPMVSFKSAQLYEKWHLEPTPNYQLTPGGLQYPAEPPGTWNRNADRPPAPPGVYNYTLPSAEATMFLSLSARRLWELHARVRAQVEDELQGYKDVKELTREKNAQLE